MGSKPIRSNVTIVLFHAFFCPNDVMYSALWHHLSSLPYQFSIFDDEGGWQPCITITFTWVSYPARHNLSVCLTQVRALKLMTVQYDRIACTELLLLPTSIQSGGWILHFLLCFRNIATHRGTSVGSDALNGPMSPWIEKQQYDPWRVYTLKRHLFYIRVKSLHINQSTLHFKTDKQSLPRSNKFCSQRSSSGSIFFPFLRRIQLLKDPLGSRGNKEHLSKEWKYKYDLK